MARFALAIAVLGALLAAAPAHARECGIPDSTPLWVDFAGHDAPLPQKPGLTLAYTSGTEKPAAARAAGAATVFFDLNFNKRVGTPTAPADPATIVEKADRLFDFAVSVTDCATPWIALNELFGAQTPTPWTGTTEQYRENTLVLLRRLAERGARPAITIANPPYTGGEAADWWREAAATALLIRQVFFTAPNVPQLHALGPVRASRAMRRGMRGLVRRFTEIGIPASRVALELQFHSSPGQGGREGLQPRSKWLEIVKLEALAARQVTRELATHSIWSWGWATVQPGRDRPGQGRSGLRLPLGARPEAVQRARSSRAGVRRLAHRRPARPSGRRHLHTPWRRDPGICGGAAPARARRPRCRQERRPRAAPTRLEGGARPPGPARCRARALRGPLRRQQLRVPRSARPRRARPSGGARCLPTSSGARRSAPVSWRRATGPPRSQRSTRPTPVSRRGSSRL